MVANGGAGPAAWPGRRRRVLVIVAAAVAVTLLVRVAIVAVRGNGDRRAAPGRASAPADFAAVYAGTAGWATLGLPTSPLPDTASLAGPHYTVQVEATATAAALTPEALVALRLADAVPPGTGPLQAATGHEFLLIHAAGSREGPADVTVEVVAGTVRQVDPRMLMTDTVAVVSVPAGSDPVLRITSEGRTQSLSLSSGIRGDDAVAGYYQPRAAGLERREEIFLDGLTRRLPDGTHLWSGVITLECGVSAVPWRSVEGWAPGGGSWLSVSCGATFTILGENDVTRYVSGVRIDLSRSLTVTLADGSAVPVAANTVLQLSPVPITGTAFMTMESDSSREILTHGVAGGPVTVIPAFRFAGTVSSAAGAPMSWRSIGPAATKPVTV